DAGRLRCAARKARRRAGENLRPDPVHYQIATTITQSQRKGAKARRTFVFVLEHKFFWSRRLCAFALKFSELRRPLSSAGAEDQDPCDAGEEPRHVRPERDAAGLHACRCDAAEKLDHEPDAEEH